MNELCAVRIPLMDQETFANETGLKKSVVRGLIDKKILPAVKVGRRRMVNMALLTADCMSGIEKLEKRQG